MADDNIAPPPGHADNIDDSDLTFYFPSSSQDFAGDGDHGHFNIQPPTSDIVASHVFAGHVDKGNLTIQPSSFADAKTRLTTRVNEARESLKKSGDFSENQISVILESLMKQPTPLRKPIKKPASLGNSKARPTSQINEARKSLEKSGDFSEHQIKIITEGLKQAKSKSPFTSSATRQAPAASSFSVRAIDKRSSANNQKALWSTIDRSEVRQSLERSGDYTEHQIKVILQGVRQTMPLAASTSSPGLEIPSPSVRIPSLGRSIFNKTPQSKALSTPGAPMFTGQLRDENNFFPTPLPKTTILPGTRRFSKSLTTFSFPQTQSTYSTPAFPQTESTWSPPGAPKKRFRNGSPPPLGPVFNRIRTHQIIERTVIPVTVTTKRPPQDPPVIIDLDQTTTLDHPPTIIDLTQEESNPSDPSNPPTDQQCLFLALPGELRNRIYRYTLLKEKSLEVTSLNYTRHQPSFLKTNRQIRSEALPIFYLENRISACIHDWSPLVKERLNRLLAAHNLKKSPDINHHFSGGPHWENLISWMKAFFEGRAGKISECVDKERSLERKTVGAMFLIVRKAKSTSYGDREQAWRRVLEVLMAHRGLLGMGDPRWLN